MDEQRQLCTHIPFSIHGPFLMFMAGHSLLDLHALYGIILIGGGGTWSLDE